MTKANSYPSHSIGKHVVPFQLVFHKNDTVEKTVATIRKKIGSWPNTEVVFVIDKQKKLIGAVDFRKLVSAPTQNSLEQIMGKDFIVLTDHSHQSSAVKIAIKRGVESIPVTTSDGSFLGIIDAGQIFKIMHEEHIERLMHFSGILDNESFIEAYKSKIPKAVQSRLPWLALGLIGGILSTLVIKSFDHTLQEELSLAFFIPLVVYMNAAVGNQTQTIFVRYSALEKVSFRKATMYELKVAAVVGAILSLGVLIFSSFWIGVRVSRIVSLSMFSGILISVLLGTFIPWLLQKMGKDAAIASGPFSTIIQDLISVVIYFTIASFLL